MTTNNAQANNEEIPLVTFKFCLNSNNDLCCKTEAIAALSKEDLEQIFSKRIRAIVGTKIMLALQSNYIKVLEAQKGTASETPSES